MSDIRAELNLKIPDSGLPLDAIARAAQQAAAALAGKYPQSELWEITIAHAGSRYTVRNALGRVMAKVQAVGPAASRLKVGQLAMVGYYDRERQKPYIKAPGGSANWGPPALPTPGIWDQTWANFYRPNAGGDCLADPQKWQDYRREVFDLNEDGFSIDWRGLAYTNDGLIYVVTRKSVGGENVALVVRLLQPTSAPDPYQLRASAEIPLAGVDRTLKDRYADADTFYDAQNDVLTIVRPYVFESTNLARIWTVQANESRTQLRWAQSQVECAYGRSLTCANVAGTRMVTLNGNGDAVFGYRLDLQSLKWSRKWKRMVEDLALPGSNFAMSGGTGNVPGVNYGPPWSDRKWFSIASQNETGRAILQELAIGEDSGSVARVTLWTQSDYTRGQPTKLDSVIDAYAAAVLAAKQGTDSHFPASGTSDEILLSHETIIGGPGYAAGPTIEWDVFLRRYWLGVLYEPHDIEVTGYIGGGEYPEVVTQPYYVPHGAPGYLTPPATELGPLIPSIPPPTGLPLISPNRIRAYHDRPFWKGETDSELGAGIRSAPARGLRLPDGSRVWCSLVPVPFFVPDYIHPYIDQGLNLSQYIGTQYWTDTGAIHQHVFSFSDQRRYTAHCPIVNFAYETRLFRVKDGAVTSRKLSQEFTNIPWPNYGGGDPIVCSENLPIPENVWELFYLPQYDQIGCLYDWRATYDEDPSPRVEMFRAQDLEPVHHLAASNLIIQFEPLVKFTEDQPDWAIAGQYEYDLHSFDLSGPQVKVWNHPDGRPVLTFGGEFQQRVNPVDGTEGFSHATMQAFILNETSFEGTDLYMAEGGNWTYPYKRNFINTENGPHVVRTMMPGTDRLVYFAENKLKELPA